MTLATAGACVAQQPGAPVVRRRRTVVPILTLPLLFAALAFDIALVPTLLPRPWWVTGIFAGVAAAEAYVVAVVLRGVVRSARRWSARRWSAWRPRPERAGDRRWLRPALVCLLLASALAGQLRQAALERGMGLDPGSLLHQVEQQVGSVTLGLAAAGLVVGLLTALAKGAELAWRVMRRPFAGSPSLRATMMVPVLVLAACTMSGTGESAAALAPTPARSAFVADAGPGASTAPGPKARQFLRGTTPASTIARVIGRPARQPLRVYAELRPDEGDEARAARGAAQLQRAGGLDRSVVVVVVPTGSGWVDPAAVSAVETLAGGDVATLAVQYADVPSWVAYLRGAGAAERSASATIRQVRTMLDPVPANQRPRLLVYGESLGALGGLRALDDSGQAVDGALWVGVPADVAELGRRARIDGQTVLVHANDPVAAWSAALALRPASGWRPAWWPVVTFWQATADLVAAYSTPDGFGHRYGAELVDGWRPVLTRAGVGPSAGLAAGTNRETALTDVRQLVTQTSDGGSSLPTRRPEP